MASVVRNAPGFKLGKKQLFLPNIVVAMIRRPKQDPNFATFKVPLRFTKFDLRDYLWNLYQVEVTKVRSFVAPAPVINSISDNAQQRARIHRGKSEKYMTVELAEPFAWPETPVDLEPWNKRLWDARKVYADEVSKMQSAAARAQTLLPSQLMPKTEDKLIAKQAKALLAGKATWSNGEVLDNKWEAVLQAAEKTAPVEEVEKAEAMKEEVKAEEPKTSV
ncbi:hypothetical protein TD95_002260 [Thielaviopsis punctulata]|uniref:Large ribosomal subunit protein uL23m n=1 Tax=Thielaviopsis punctulata TaxID=72032 RepID=A0A0F4ZJP3_9PEZI|nr:hypothetical protein TD95_002260 [Thielaviopsis punctulata]